MKKKMVLVVELKLKQIRKIKLPEILDMMVKEMRFHVNKLQVKPMELVQVLEIWMIMLLLCHLLRG